MTSQPRSIWYRLVDSSTGPSYMGASADQVSVASDANVVSFRKAVKAENPNKLSSIDASDLVVYINKDAFDKRNDAGKKKGPLEEDSLISDLGTTMDEALIVLAPTVLSSSIPSVIASTRKESHPKLLYGNVKRSKLYDSTAYSYVTWNQVKAILNPEEYVQLQKKLPNEESFNDLVKHLSYTTKCFGNIWTGTEAKRRYFIAPILIYVCALFDGEVEIAVEEDWTGDFVKARGQFEFIIRRGAKVICIVEAKKRYDIEQGMAQDLVGCEVAAEVGELDIVYGIVTNYYQWYFLRSMDEKIDGEAFMLQFEQQVPQRESLLNIVEKMYAMLSDD